MDPLNPSQPPSPPPGNGGEEPGCFSSLIARIRRVFDALTGQLPPSTETTSALTQSTNAASLGYEEILQKWENTAPPEDKADYQEAVAEFLKFFQDETQNSIKLRRSYIPCLPDIWSLPACKERLQTLQIQECICITTLPESIGDLKALTSLNLAECVALKNLPKSIGNLQALKSLDINCCKSLTDLPESIGNLQMLEFLNLDNCPLIVHLPPNLPSNCTINRKGCPFLGVEPPNIAINSFEHITRYLSNCDTLLQQTNGREKEIDTLCQNLEKGDWTNILQKRRLGTLPLDGLRAFRDNRITGEQFTTLMIYWSTFSQLSGDQINIQPIFDTNGKVLQNAKIWIEETIGREFDENLLKDCRLRKFFAKMKSKPKSEQAFLYISMESYSKTKNNLDQTKIAEEVASTGKSREELSAKYEKTICGQLKRLNFNVLREFSHLGKTHRMIPSLGMMQTLLEAHTERQAITITPVIGLSTLEDIKKNGLEGTRDMALPFPGVELPKMADLSSAPLDIDFIAHDLYHSVVTNGSPDVLRKALIKAADVVLDLQKEEHSSDVKKFLEEFYERFIDMEYPVFRTRPTPSKNLFYEIVEFHAAAAIARLFPPDPYAKKILGEAKYTQEWSDRQQEIQNMPQYREILKKFTDKLHLLKIEKEFQ